MLDRTSVTAAAEFLCSELHAAQVFGPDLPQSQGHHWPCDVAFGLAARLLIAVEDGEEKARQQRMAERS